MLNLSVLNNVFKANRLIVHLNFKIMKRVSVLMALLMMGAATFAEVPVKSEKVSSVMVVVDDDLVGEYQFAGESPIKNLTIEKSGDALIGKTETGQSELVATDKKDTYSLKDYGGTLEFRRDESGAVKGVTLKVENNSFEGTKK